MAHPHCRKTGWKCKACSASISHLCPVIMTKAPKAAPQAYIRIQNNLGIMIEVTWENGMRSRVKGSDIRRITRGNCVVSFSSISSSKELSGPASDIDSATFILQKHCALPLVVRARSKPYEVIILCGSSTEDKRDRSHMVQRLREYYEKYDCKPLSIVGPCVNPTNERKPVAAAKHVKEKAIAESLDFGTDSKDSVIYTHDS